MKKRAIIYLRFSDPKQVGNTSEESQEKISRNACLAESYDVVEIVKNPAVSANKTNTQRIIELLDFCKARKGQFEILMVYKLDRFARSQEQHHWLRGQLLKLGVVLRSATERIDESPSGRLVEGVLAAVNEYDNEVKKERVKLAMWTRVEQGLWPWHPPVGYKPDRRVGVKLSRHIFDENCCHAIKYIFAQYASGLVTKTELSLQMRQKRLKSYRGKNLKFSLQTVDNLLNNIYFTGVVKHKDGRLIKGHHEALIDSGVFQRCQEVQAGLSNHATRKRVYQNPDFPLRRFVLCGDCGKPLTACWSKSAHSGRYAYYYCTNKDCHRYSEMIRKADLENEFSIYLRNIKPNDEFIERFNEVFIRRYYDREQEVRGDYLRQIDEIKEMEVEELWLIRKGKDGILPDHVLKQQLEDLEQKLTLAKMSLTDTHAEELDIKALLAYSYDFIRTLENTWYEALPEYKVTLQRVIFPKGVTYNFPAFSNPEISPLFAAIESFGVKESTLVTPRGIEPRFSG